MYQELPLWKALKKTACLESFYSKPRERKIQRCPPTADLKTSCWCEREDTPSTGVLGPELPEDLKKEHPIELSEISKCWRVCCVGGERGLKVLLLPPSPPRGPTWSDPAGGAHPGCPPNSHLETSPAVSLAHQSRKFKQASFRQNCYHHLLKTLQQASITISWDSDIPPFVKKKKKKETILGR